MRRSPVYAPGRPPDSQARWSGGTAGHEQVEHKGQTERGPARDLRELGCASVAVFVVESIVMINDYRHGQKDVLDPLASRDDRWMAFRMSVAAEGHSERNWAVDATSGGKQ